MKTVMIRKLSLFGGYRHNVLPSEFVLDNDESIVHIEVMEEITIVWIAREVPSDAATHRSH